MCRLHLQPVFGIPVLVVILQPIFGLPTSFVPSVLYEFIFFVQTVCADQPDLMYPTLVSPFGLSLSDAYVHPIPTSFTLQG
jgi:hypothetical protein